MSYILEALRRAETERERRRRVPGLHAQPVPAASSDEAGPRRGGKVWLWVALGVGTGVLLPLLWRWWVIDPITAEAAAAARAPLAGSVTPQATVDAAPPPTAAASAAAAAQAAASQAPAPAPELARPPRPAHAPPKTAAAAPRANAGTPEQAPGATTAPTHAPRPAASAPAQAPAAVTAAPEPKLRSLNEMPEDLRRAVPTLSFGGSVYSEIATQRMVIFNGQVLREGDAVTDEVTLEQIRPRSAVMRVRGQRFEIAF